jgi:hypothetical protein
VSISEQQCVRAELRARFPNLRWLDIVSKCDLPYQPLQHNNKKQSAIATNTIGTTYTDYIGAIDDGGGEIIMDAPPQRPPNDEHKPTNGKGKRRYGDIEDDDNSNDSKLSAEQQQRVEERARGGISLPNTTPSVNATKAEIESDEYRWRRQRAINEVASNDRTPRVLPVITYHDQQPTHALHVSTTANTGLTDLKFALYHHFQDSFPDGFAQKPQ